MYEFSCQECINYGSLCSNLARGTGFEEAPTEGKIMLVQAAGGIIAGATAACITTPLDTIKTRLQVFCSHATNYHAISFIHQLHCLLASGFALFIMTYERGFYKDASNAGSLYLVKWIYFMYDTLYIRME